MALEKRLESLLTQTAGVNRRGIPLEERQRDLRVDAEEHLASARPKAGELIAQLVGQPDPRAHQTLSGSCHRPQRLGLIAVGHKHPKTMTIRASQLGQHKAVKAV